MAWMETHYYSHELYSNVTLNVLVPTPTSDEMLTGEDTGEKYNYEKGLPVVYLLHGAHGDAFSWMRFSNIERYAQARGIVVVMASAENSFYQNLKGQKNYKNFFLEELPRFIQNVFPVSKKREDTYIAGFSMGGYGAWFLALTKPELYAKSASLSGALDVVAMFGNEAYRNNDRFNLIDGFEDLTTLKGSPYDLIALYDKCVKEGCVPKLYQCVGTEDFLYLPNQNIRKSLEEKQADITYEEGKGGHDWNYWEGTIERVLDWLLEK